MPLVTIDRSRMAAGGTVSSHMRIIPDTPYFVSVTQAATIFDRLMLVRTSRR